MMIDCLQNSILPPSYLRMSKIMIEATAILIITTVAITIIGCIPSIQGPFNTFIQVAIVLNSSLLGISTVFLLLNLVFFSNLGPQQVSVPGTDTTLPHVTDPRIPNESEGLTRENVKGPFNKMPTEIVQTIFSFLRPQDLGRCCLVSKKWHTHAKDLKLWQAFDLKRISSQIRTFDVEDWLLYADPKLGLDVSDAPPLNNSVVIPQLFKFLSSCNVEGNPGITLLTVPKNLTLPLLKKFSESPLQGQATHFNSPRFDFLNALLERGSKSQPNAQTYRVIIANGLIKGTRGSFSFCNDIIDHMQEYKFPDLLSLSAHLVTAYICRDQAMHVFSDCPKTLVMCSDRFPDTFRMTFVFVGNFRLDGFDAYALVAPLQDLEYIGYGMQIKLTEEYFIN